MTTEETAEMERLCQLIQVERDTNKFHELIRQLNDLLGRKEQRLNPGEGKRPS